MSFSSLYHRCENKDFLIPEMLHDEIDNLLIIVFHHFLTCFIGISLRGTGIKKPQKIVYFGNGAYRRSWIFIGCFLLDGNHRTKSRNLIYIRSLQIPEELPGIGRKGFYISSLSFSINCVKCKGGFSTATQTGYNCKSITWNLNIYIFQVMNASSKYFYLFILPVY